jgi:hypothetical protein
MSELSRRQFIKNTAAAAAALQWAGAGRVGAEPASNAEPQALQPVELHWLEGQTPALLAGTAWGMPWPQGAAKRDQAFQAKTDKGESVPVQTWPLAYWPDGSLKWTGHAIGSSEAPSKLTIVVGAPAVPVQSVTLRETAQTIEVDTGVIRCRIGKSGGAVIELIERDGKPIAKDGRLVCLRQDRSAKEQGVVRQEKFSGVISKASVEQSGPVRAVVKLEGKHASAEPSRAWLPFTLRLYFYAGGETVRIMHSFVFDGDESKDFIQGLGVSFTVPMRDALHDRHVRFAGEGNGLWAEGVRNLTGLRRDPGAAVTQKQLAGEACPPVGEFPDAVRTRLKLIPAWNDYTLFQPTADSFQIHKRTAEDCCWLAADQGRRAAGLGYIGGVSGGLAFGLRDFWQRHPTQLDIRGATSDNAVVTLWFWAPDAPTMDLRFYHQGMGMDTHPEEIEGLEITYEDYEKGFATAVGIARSSEIMLWAVAATPTRNKVVEMAHAVQTPPMLACRPEHHHSAAIFGALWNLPARSTPVRAKIEDQLDWSISYYQKQIEQRRWYGFWNYGDVMHTYDQDRHVWRYDVGGFAWDNSELSTDLWLWYSFLRTGRADIFRMAEAMTRHTGEVDVYHAGRFAGLGTRHGVVHWGDSAKQMRISTGINRRFYYYLTADERVGDLLREVVHADARLAEINPVRKLPGEPAMPAVARMGVGTDWGSAASNWLTEWERTGDAQPRAWLENSMKTIGTGPHGFLAGAFGYEPATKTLVPLKDGPISVSHLSAVFGLVEVCAELIALLDIPEFEKAWLQYCELYNASEEEQMRALGVRLKGNTLRDAHSRLTAYAAWKKKDKKLAERAWQEFLGQRGSFDNLTPAAIRLEGPAVLNPVDEAAAVSTNGTAQWGLAAIQNLCLIADDLPAEGAAAR